jgi:hypothetical protein
MVQIEWPHYAVLSNPVPNIFLSGAFSNTLIQYYSLSERPSFTPSTKQQTRDSELTGSKHSHNLIFF